MPNARSKMETCTQSMPGRIEPQAVEPSASDTRSRLKIGVREILQAAGAIACDL
ncbi:hypothetical protein [Phenylobacterium sp.]|uniref:hypothetical protein n=1 Tax=Phenylobacterium sp. TaxID=1871053 RepID=UPI0027375D35|nr:hypothetical protein [Phenylobacterium sp.]